MKLTQLKIHDIMFDHTEDEFVPEAIQQITKSKWNHVKSISRIDDYTPDGIFIAEAISGGYKERTLRKSIEENDKETLVCRYHADGVGGKELNISQLMSMYSWDERKLSQGIAYGFTQLAALAILKQVDNDSIIGRILAEKFEETQRNIEEFVPQMICSEAVFRKFNESNCPIRILKDSKHLEHYTHGDGVLKRYVQNHPDGMDDIIEDWLSPHDLFQSPDIITMDTIEVNWR